MRIILFLLFPLLLAAQSQPNIVLIVADDAGNGDFSFNQALYSTPRIDSLKANGTYFSRCYAAPVCTPSRAMLMTGRYAWRQSLGTHVIYYHSDRHLPLEEKTIADYLSAKGYATAIVGKWHLGHAHPEYLPQNRGFDYWYGISQGNATYYTYTVEGGYDLHENGLDVRPDSIYLTELLADKCVEYINAQARCQEQPFFLYVPHLAPHVSNDATIEVPSDSLALAPGGYTTAQKRYWVMMKIFDNAVGEIIDALEANGLDSNTVVILTSDNGANVNYSGSNSPYSGNKATLNEGGMRVPMIWYKPGTITSRTVDSLVHFVDVLPSIWEGVLGLSFSQSDNYRDGINIWPLVTGSGGISANRYIIPMMIPNRSWVIYQNDYKLVNNRTVTVQDTASLADNIELFNVVQDSGETTDSSAILTSKATALQNIITPYLDSIVNNQDIYLTKPAGWGDEPPIWASPKLFYDPAYFFFRN